jgi:hypothetical protein
VGNDYKKNSSLAPAVALVDSRGERIASVASLGGLFRESGACVHLSVWRKRQQ